MLYISIKTCFSKNGTGSEGIRTSISVPFGPQWKLCSTGLPCCLSHLSQWLLATAPSISSLFRSTWLVLSGSSPGQVWSSFLTWHQNSSFLSSDIFEISFMFPSLISLSWSVLRVILSRRHHETHCYWKVVSQACQLGDKAELFHFLQKENKSKIRSWKMGLSFPMAVLQRVSEPLMQLSCSGWNLFGLFFPFTVTSLLFQTDSSAVLQ